MTTLHVFLISSLSNRLKERAANENQAKLLRDGHPPSAYACLSTASHVLSPDSGQRSRQLNYSTLNLYAFALRI